MKSGFLCSVFTPLFLLLVYAYRYRYVKKVGREVLFGTSVTVLANITSRELSKPHGQTRQT